MRIQTEDAAPGNLFCECVELGSRLLCCLRAADHGICHDIWNTKWLLSTGPCKEHNGNMGMNGDVPFNLDQVEWLHTNVSQWPVTTMLSVSFQGGNICLEYDKKNTWPAVAIPHSSGMGNVDVVANPWVFIEHENQWYAGTWEWLAVNSTCKSMTSVAGDHIKRSPFLEMDWRPRSGERLFFMVSALARFSDVANVQERSQIVEVIWP